MWTGRKIVCEYEISRKPFCEESFCDREVYTVTVKRLLGRCSFVDVKLLNWLKMGSNSLFLWGK